MGGMDISKCPYGFTDAFARLDPATGEIIYHETWHRHHKGEGCLFADYDPANPDFIPGGCSAPRDLQEVAGGYTLGKLGLNFPTPKGWRWHHVNHLQFHAKFPEYRNTDCPWHPDFVDSPRYPWSRLNPVHVARRAAYLAGRRPDASDKAMGVVAAVAEAGVRAAASRSEKRGRKPSKLLRFLSAPTVAEGIRAAR